MVIIVILIVIVVVAVSFVAWNGRGSRKVKGGPAPQQFANPQHGPHLPAQPGFVVEHRQEPGFVVVKRTGIKPPPHPRTARPARPGTARGLNDTVITTNLSAICKLTGSKVAACSCGRCQAARTGKR